MTKRHKLPIYQPISPAQRALLRKNRQLDHLKQLALEKTIKSCVNADNTLKNNVKLLCSTPAIGFTTAVQLIAYLGDGHRFKNAKAAATFAGLTPMIKRSGKSLNTVMDISKIG